MEYGISPGAKTERGLATTKAILSYLGKPFKPVAGTEQILYGWHDIYRVDYPKIGKRWMANCDIPDLDVLPPHYNIKHIRFSAGLESAVIHLGMRALAWLVKVGIIRDLPRHAAFLLKLSHYFDWLGTADGGMHVVLKGKDKNGNAHTRTCFIIALNDDGPNIPTIPAIILAKKLYRDELTFRGATACVGLVSLAEYLAELEGLAVYTVER